MLINTADGIPHLIVHGKMSASMIDRDDRDLFAPCKPLPIQGMNVKPRVHDHEIKILLS